MRCVYDRFILAKENHQHTFSFDKNFANLSKRSVIKCVWDLEKIMPIEIIELKEHDSIQICMYLFL